MFLNSTALNPKPSKRNLQFADEDAQGLLELTGVNSMGLSSKDFAIYMGAVQESLFIPNQYPNPKP